MEPDRHACRQGRRSRGSFTLIELLVVIAIISMLISILTPSLSRARQQAKATVCMASLAEIMKAVTAYTHDHDFALPLAQYPIREPQPGDPHPPLHGWAELLHTYLFEVRDYSWEHDYPVLHNLEGAYPLFVCKEALPLENHTGHYRVYELTWATGNLDRAKYNLPLITDANPEVLPPPIRDPNHAYYRTEILKTQIAGLEGEAYIDERHYGGANYAFRDGHVERSTKLKEELAEDWDLDPETENR